MSFLLRSRLRDGARRQQRDQANIRAAADPLQYQMAKSDRRFGAAEPQRVGARLVETGFTEIAEAEQRARGGAGADEQAVAGESRDRGVDAFDQAAQPVDQRHRAADRFCGGDQNPGAAIGEKEPGAGAGHQRAERRAEAAQPFQPRRAVLRQLGGELGDLTAMRIGGTEAAAGKLGGVGGAKQPGGDWVRP